MKAILPCLLLFFSLVSCSSYRKNIVHIRKNPDEILAFKQYLEENYNIDSITKYETIWGTFKQTDTVILNFCKKNNISSIIKLPKAKSDDYYYNRFGSIVELNFEHTPFVERNQTIIFDYTENGLEVYNSSYSKFKVADKVYIFF
jgi:hypothetical protein